MTEYTKVVKLFDSSKDHFPTNIVELKVLVDRLYLEVPESFRENSYVELSAYQDYDYYSGNVEIYYHRPMTESEKFDEIKAHRKMEDIQRRADLQIIASMKKKYPEEFKQ